VWLIESNLSHFEFTNKSTVIQQSWASASQCYHEKEKKKTLRFYRHVTGSQSPSWEQRLIFSNIRTILLKCWQVIIFVDGPAGCNKYFLLNFIWHLHHGHGYIEVIFVASRDWVEVEPFTRTPDWNLPWSLLRLPPFPGRRDHFWASFYYWRY
jgi:hypothetical protein